MLLRPRDLEPIKEDQTRTLVLLMGVDAKLDEIRHLLSEDDDGEAPGP